MSELWSMKLYDNLVCSISFALFCSPSSLNHLSYLKTIRQTYASWKRMNHTILTAFIEKNQWMVISWANPMLSIHRP